MELTIEHKTPEITLPDLLPLNSRPDLSSLDYKLWVDRQQYIIQQWVYQTQVPDAEDFKQQRRQ